jgi:hypothetical protein
VAPSGTSVELDAIPARKLRELVRECIERHVDRSKLEFLRVAEKSERELLEKWATTYGALAISLIAARSTNHRVAGVHGPPFAHTRRG